mgnify:CR=1 FL=1
MLYFRRDSPDFIHKFPPTLSCKPRDICVICVYKTYYASEQLAGTGGIED